MNTQLIISHCPPSADGGTLLKTKSVKKKIMMINKMKHGKVVYSLVVLITSIGLVANPVSAQDSEPYSVGDPVGMTSDGEFQPISSNVSVYGAI